MSEYNEFDEDSTVRLDEIQREVDKIRMDREMGEQLSDRVVKGIGWFDAYGSLTISTIMVLSLFIIFLIIIPK